MSEDSVSRFDNTLLVKRLEEELPEHGVIDAEEYIIIESSREFRFVAEIDPLDLTIHAVMTVDVTGTEADSAIGAERARWVAAGFRPEKPGRWRPPLDPIVREGDEAFVEFMVRESADVEDLVRVIAWLEGDET